MLKENQIRTIIQGKELPFITVPDGIAYGEAKVELARAEMEAAMGRSETLNLGQDQTQNPNQYPTQRFRDPEEIGALNFTELLQAEQKKEEEIPAQQEELENQKEEHQGRDNKKLEVNPELSGKELEDLEETIDAKKAQISSRSDKTDSRSKKEKDKKAKEEMTSRSTRENVQRLGATGRDEQANIRKEDRVDEKSLREQSLNELKRDVNERNQELETKQKTGKTIEVSARYQERVHLDDHTGKETFKQTEIAKERTTGGAKEKGALGDLAGSKSNGKSNSIADKVQTAKANARADSFMQSLATVTHVTGRTTEFNVGKDVLQFRREGDDTNAYKNGKQIDPKQTREMIKDLVKQIGESGLRRIEVLSKNPMVQQKTMSELTKSDTSAVQKTKKEKTKEKEQRSH